MRRLLVLSAFAALLTAPHEVRAAAPPPVKILHTAATEAEKGAEVLIKCVITAKNGVYLPTVYYRLQGQRQFYPVPLIPIEGDLYATAVPGLFFSKNLEYYIEARDVKDFTEAATAATADAPFVVKAVEKKAKISQVAISSDPTGAELALDGRDMGLTPFLGTVDPGEHTLVVSKAKFKTAQATINVGEGRDLDLRYPLSPASQPAVLAVVTDPAGANVTLDAKELGKTPFIGPAPEGSHELVIQKEGFHKISRSMSLVNDRNAEVSVTLLKLPPEPVLAITTEPAGATLTIDGTEIGKTPFFQVVAPGEHELSLQKDGLRGVGAQIIMPKDRDLDLRYTLDPQPPKPLPPQIAISSDPADAEITIDGAPAGKTPLLQPLPAGEHKVRLTHDGFVPYERKLVMPKDRDMELTLALNPVPPPPGPSKIEISAEPAEAEVFVDGKKGKLPWKGIRNPGEYVVEAKAPGFRSLTQKFTVTQGQGVNLKLALTPLPKEASAPLLTIVSDPKGAKVLVDGKEIGTTPYSGETTPGEHVIAMALNEYKGREEKFKIPADKEFELRVNWTLNQIRKSVTVASAAKKDPPKPPPDAQEAKKIAAANPQPVSAVPAAALAPAAPCTAEKCPPASASAVQRVYFRPGLLPWIATGVGLVAVGTGIGFSVQAQKTANTIRTTPNLDANQQSSLLSSFQRQQRTSFILFGAGGGLAAGVDLYWLLSSMFNKDPPPVALEAPAKQPTDSKPEAAAAKATKPKGESPRAGEEPPSVP